MAVDQKRPIVVDYFSYHKELDPSKIQTAGQFRVLANILRALTQLDANGQITGNLADSWHVRENYTKFDFSIDSRARFSDGTKITAQDVAASLKRQMKFNSGNHYDFSAIENVIVEAHDRITIILKKPNDSFIRHTSYPEFGVLSREDANQPYGKINLYVTSGAYSLSDRGNGYFTVKENKYFTGFNPQSPSSIRFQFSDPVEKVRGLLAGRIDFSASSAPIEREEFAKIEAAEHLTVARPNLGYSVWISINPNSKIFSNIDRRREVQSALSQASFNFDLLKPFWMPARQLYLPDGLGRPDEGTLDRFWESLKNGTTTIEKKGDTISILLEASFPFKQQLFTELRKIGYKINATEISSGTEFFKQLSHKKFDLVQSRNDFSSVDLNENLQTTFNPKFPLIYTTEKENYYHKELSEALASDDEMKKHEIYRRIALDLLNKAYIIPIAYYKVIWVHNKGLSLENVSKVMPDSGMWKLKVTGLKKSELKCAATLSK